jgi:tRNA-specific 2-thiouridylase
VGDLCKQDVRRIAAEHGLPVADKAESMEICFVPDGDYAAFVERQAGAADRSGPIVDEAGTTIGRHDGVHRFTVGQRRGLGLTSARPLYVLRVLPETRTVVVGGEDALGCGSCTVGDVNWLSIDAPSGPIEARVRIRHRHTEAAAVVHPLPDGRAHVAFEVPQRAVTPGQAAVFYDGDVCLGGGWIQPAD